MPRRDLFIPAPHRPMHALPAAPSPGRIGVGGNLELYLTQRHVRNRASLKGERNTWTTQPNKQGRSEEKEAPAGICRLESGEFALESLGQTQCVHPTMSRALDAGLGGVTKRGQGAYYCGWTKSYHCLLVFTRESSFQGFLGAAGFRPSHSIHHQHKTNFKG